MIRWRPRGLPIFWQTLLLLFSSLIVVQLVSIALILTLPPPRGDFNRLSDVADALAGQQFEYGDRERALAVVTRSHPPEPDGDMVTEPAFTDRLARHLGVEPSRVHLFFEADQRGSFPFRRGDRDGQVPMRRGEPIFFNTVVAALDTGHGWRIVQTPPRPLINAWQKRAMLWFALSALLLLPFAGFFTRRLTRPIRRIAEVADRLGADPFAPAVPEEGPAELRVTAHALNRMQQRLVDYVGERTAMIGAIAHDLRTPLARIAFRIEAAPAELREKVQADVEQMRAMIAATIGFVRGTVRSTARQPVELRPLLEELVALDQEMGRPVDLAADGGAPIISGDPLALGRLFQNLIDNAVTYGGAAHVSLIASSTMATVIVADNGPGLPEDALQRVFQPFERGEPSRNRQTGGIGLGLTIARTIAEDHGGTVTLRNRPESGLEARCEIPLR